MRIRIFHTPALAAVLFGLAATAGAQPAAPTATPTPNPDVVKAMTPAKFVMPEAAYQTLTDSQKSEAATKIPKFDAASYPLAQLPDDPLSKLNQPSRTWTPNTGPSAHGVKSIWEYTNDGAKNTSNTCGQAAIATLLTYHKLYPAVKDGSLIRKLEKAFPPDGYLGMVGTSWQRMTSMAKNYHLKPSWGKGEADLRSWVAAGYPVVVMMDVARDQGGWNLDRGGHWTVVYAYDKNFYYCTNWENGPAVSAVKFRKGWNTWLHNAAGGIGNMFMAVTK